MPGGIKDHNQIHVRTSSIGQGVVTIIDATNIDRKRSIERSVFGGFDGFWRNFQSHFLQDV